MRNQTPRHGFTLWQIALVLATLGLLAAILFPVFDRPREGRRALCQSNLKQVMLGVKQYVQDWDEKHPLIGSNAQVAPLQNGVSAFGWADSLQPYLKSAQIFQCDVEPNGQNLDPTQPGYTDYWFNGRMAGVWEAQLDHQALTVALGDGESSDARNHIRSISQIWRDNTSSPLYRHKEGAHFAFADGHAKWFRGSKWENNVDLVKGGVTFRLKPKN